MSVVKEVSAFAKAVRERALARGESEPAARKRAAAAERYEELPTPRYEKSDISRRNTGAFQVAPKDTPGPSWEELARPYLSGGESSPAIVVADGHVVLARGLEGLRAQGVVFRDLGSALAEDPDRVLEHLGTVVAEEDRLLALNAALWRGGVYLRVPAGVRIEEPVQFVSVTTEGGHGTFVRNLIVAEAQSQAVFVESYTGAEDLSDELQVNVTEIVALEGSSLRIGTVDDPPQGVTSVLARRARALKDASVEFVVGEVGSGFTVAEFGAFLDGDGSRSASHAVVLGSGGAHTDLTGRMTHRGRFSESDTLARGVMQSGASGVYRGVTHILKGAGGANGQQAERLLMLGTGSRADAIPMLLIDENDVKCGHAASVGQINEEQLFYLMSRGISEKDAKRMIVRGFLDPVIGEMPLETVKQTLLDIIERKMA